MPFWKAGFSQTVIIGLSASVTRWNGMASALLEYQVVSADLKIYKSLISRHKETLRQCAVVNLLPVWSVCGEQELSLLY